MQKMKVVILCCVLFIGVGISQLFDSAHQAPGRSDDENDDNIMLANSAVIENDDETLLTPCKYFVSGKVSLAGKKEKIKEITSFRGRFCDHATIGERVKGYGTIEKVTRNSGVSYYRIILGEKRNHFLIVVGNKQ